MSDKKELQVVQYTGEISVMDKLLGAVVNNGMSVETLEKFMDLAERNQKREAENAFHKAFAEFKANPPKIIKDKLVDFTAKSGVRTKYKQATIGAVVGAIIEGMSQHGLSHCWELGQDGDRVTVTCKITHSLGHSESTTLTAGVDLSGNKNAIQGIGSTVTYLERYTIQAATGIAVLENDDDGRTHQPPKKQEQKPIDSAYWQDKLDRECKKEHAAIMQFQAKHKKQIDAMSDKKERTDTYAYISAMLAEYPPAKSDLLKKIEDGCPLYTSLDVFTEKWETVIIPLLTKLSKEEHAIAEQCRIETINRLTGETK